MKGKQLQELSVGLSGGHLYCSRRNFSSLPLTPMSVETWTEFLNLPPCSTRAEWCLEDLLFILRSCSCAGTFSQSAQIHKEDTAVKMQQCCRETSRSNDHASRTGVDYLPLSNCGSKLAHSLRRYGAVDEAYIRIRACHFAQKDPLRQKPGDGFVDPNVFDRCSSLVLCVKMRRYFVISSSLLHTPSFIC